MKRLIRDELIHRKLQYYVDKLENRESCGLARYGDGEWLTILGYYGQTNSNGCMFTKELSEDLICAIKKEHRYDYSILGVAFRKMYTKIKAWLESQGVEIDWIRGDFLLQANIAGKLYPLIEQLRKRKVLYVGPRHCRNLHPDFFEIVAFVEPPMLDSHLRKQEIEQDIFNALDKTDIDFVGFSAGLAGKVFIGDVWEYTDGEIPLIDFGSSWDGYFDVQSRSYIRRGGVNFPEIRKLNLQEARDC